MVMDWREMAGWPTVHGLQGDDRRGWSMFRGAYSGGHKVGTGTWIDPFKEGNTYYQWDGRTDSLRGWVIAACWLASSAAECDFPSKYSGASSDVFFSVVYIYSFIRRPRLVLDFTLTLLLFHLVLTTYYSGSLPTSFFVWFIMSVGAASTVIFAEQLCVRREMREGLQTLQPSNIEAEEIELGTRRPTQGLRED